MNISLLRSVAALALQGYDPHRIIGNPEDPANSLVELVKTKWNPTDDEPGSVLIELESGNQYVPRDRLALMSEDIVGIFASLGLSTDGTKIHDVVPLAVQRIGHMQERLKKLESVVRGDQTIEEAELD